jgi:predicted dehydrogenase
MIAMMGPVKRVAGSARITFPERTFTCAARNGEKISVEVPTHVTGLLDFRCGAVATIITSCDVWGANLPRVEIYGTEGTISMPDPNTFGGPVRILKPRGEWTDVELTHSYAEQSRGVGIADKAYAIRSGRPLRASGELAFHVLDIMQAVHESSDQGNHVTLASTCNRPNPLPQGLKQGQLDA